MSNGFNRIRYNLFYPGDDEIYRAFRSPKKCLHFWRQNTMFAYPIALMIRSSDGRAFATADPGKIETILNSMS